MLPLFEQHQTIASSFLSHLGECIWISPLIFQLPRWGHRGSTQCASRVLSSEPIFVKWTEVARLWDVSFAARNAMAPVEVINGKSNNQPSPVSVYHWVYRMLLIESLGWGRMTSNILKWFLMDLVYYISFLVVPHYLPGSFFTSKLRDYIYIQQM